MAERDELIEAIRLAGRDGNMRAVSALNERLQRLDAAEAANPRNDSALTGLAGGAVKPVDNLAEWASKIPVVGPAVDRLGVALGMPSTADAVANNEAMRRNNTRTGWQTVGNIGGTLPTALLPGGLLAQGAASGALLSDGKNATDIGTDALVGGLVSKGAGMGLNALSSAIAPRVSRGVRKLADAGVMMTPGQMLSGSRSWLGQQLSKLEENATSVWGLGDAIQNARQLGSESLQRAVGNRALGNIGASIPRRIQPGEQTIDYVGQRLGREYDRLVPNLKAVFDQDFADGLAMAVQQVKPLPKATQGKLKGILDDVFTNRSQGKGIEGQMLKDAESRLTEWINRYAKSTDGDQKALGEALRTAREALRASVVRSNPQHAKQLQDLNRGWAQSRVLKKASEGAPEFIPSPQQLFQASRASGVRDPLIRSGAARLRNTTPDSGTARRGSTVLGIGALASGGLGALVTPGLALPAAASLLYTKPGMKALNKAVLAPRGPVAKRAAQALRQASYYAAPLLAPFTNSPSNK